ncbi:SLC13 family permease [Flavimarina sp. Hel_I_48]|uniref:SLC13 family permease n=1 Tax=Flavimarina sp. Hel_I_48 TaxID=1392488 RepID=UPI0004DEF9F5|nr:SLC13 family permease [Flavimarina sp. Hel_I_48]
MKTTKIIGGIMGPLLFVYLNYFFAPEGLSPAAQSTLACAAWIAVWWTMEVMPIAATALLPIILFPMSGALPLDITTASYGHKYVYLFVGGFLIAIAIEKWNLHRRIALNIINLIGTSVNRIILGFMVATAFLSMWISNTATTVMMLPIGMAIVSQLKDNPASKGNEHLTFGKGLMLAIAYAASIGGMATLIGTPPNLILAGVLEESYGVEISFIQWMKFGLPVSALLLAICYLYLTHFAFSKGNDLAMPKQFPGGREEINRLITSLGKMSREERIVLVVFAATAFCWMFRAYLLQPLFPEIDDTIIAVFFALVLFLIPSKKDEKGMLLHWEEAVKLPWGILLLYGGGLALASAFSETGLAEWIGMQLTSIENISLILLLFILIAAVNFLTEITSNLATTAMLLPVIVPVALIFNTHPYILMVGVTVAASCAFMLPVATPPNAIVFGSGYLRIPDMVKTGVWMNIISILLLTMMTYYLLPYLWDFIPDSFPSNFRKPN